jgi:hypothetical protein
MYKFKTGDLIRVKRVDAPLRERNVKIGDTALVVEAEDHWMRLTWLNPTVTAKSDVNWSRGWGGWERVRDK